MAECRCDTCLNSRAIISENGYHSVCCLSQKKRLIALQNGKIIMQEVKEHARQNKEVGRND